MRRLLAAALLATAGCAGPNVSQDLRLPPPEAGAPVTARVRFSIDIESPWMSGRFDGMALARFDASPAVRVQLFPDMGPKAVDLSARPDRIVGYFPFQKQGVDCSLPTEAAPHFLLFMGATLLERYVPIRARLKEASRQGEGWQVELHPVVEGTEVSAFLGPDVKVYRRSYGWVRGVDWEERRLGDSETLIRASRIEMRVRILEEKQGIVLPPDAFDLALPADVRVVLGSRK